MMQTREKASEMLREMLMWLPHYGHGIALPLSEARMQCDRTHHYTYMHSSKKKRITVVVFLKAF